MRRVFVPFSLAISCLAFSPDHSLADPANCPSSRYYMLLFGGQGNVLSPRTAHTWATYVKATTQPDGTVSLERFTISWLPTNLNVRPWAIRSEPGANLDLYQTLVFMSGRRRRISLWGPFEIRESYYHNAARHRAVLESGAFAYRVVDLYRLQGSACHCVHAVSDTDPALRRATPPILWFGELVTAPVAAALMRSGVVVDPHTYHDWLLPTLGLCDQDFIRRRSGHRFPILRR